LEPEWNEWQVIYTQYWTSEFNNIVRKRIPYSSELALETMEEVRQELAIKLNELEQPPASLKAYLRAAFRNTLEDYLRKKEGYPRPPEWIKRLGSAYERIYKLLCLEQRAVNDIHSIMTNLYQFTREFIERVIREVRAGVINCGQWRQIVSVDNPQAEVDLLNTQSHHVASPELILQGMDASALFGAILGENVVSSANATETINKVITSIRQCEISDDERLLLRLVYSDGQTVSAAARLINIPDAEARKLLKNVLKRLRHVLIEVGVVEV
jgi:RNA polymerase sigma factor (sigma-70 family)